MVRISVVSLCALAASALIASGCGGSGDAATTAAASNECTRLVERLANTPQLADGSTDSENEAYAERIVAALNACPTKDDYDAALSRALNGGADPTDDALLKAATSRRSSCEFVRLVLPAEMPTLCV